jgi:hypothetical protein
MTTQVCKDCGEDKPLDQYYLLQIMRKKGIKNYYHKTCKNCRIGSAMTQYNPKLKGLNKLNQEQKAKLKTELLEGKEPIKAIARKYPEVSYVSIYNWSKKIEILD